MPKIPNPFDKPRAGKKAYAYAVRKGPKGGVDNRPTERVTPRKPKPRPMPMPKPKGPKGDGPKPRPMPMPKGPSRNLKPKPMPYGPPKRRVVPKALPSYVKPRRKG